MRTHPHNPHVLSAQLITVRSVHAQAHPFFPPSGLLDAGPQRAHARRLVVVAFLVGALLTSSFAALAASVGEWKLSGEDGCPTGTICADWEVDGVVQTSCCIEPRYIGTSNFAACAIERPPIL